MGEPLDTNKELNTVGWSNIISGLTGGFTGRYGLARQALTPAVEPWFWCCVVKRGGPL